MITTRSQRAHRLDLLRQQAAASALQPMPISARLFLFVFFITGLAFVILGARDWSNDGVIGVGMGIFFIAFSVWTLFLRAKLRNARFGGAGMKVFMVVAGLGIVVAVLGGIISSSKEQARQRAVVNDVRSLVNTCMSMGSSSSIAIKGKALVWDITSDSKWLAYNMLPPELQVNSSDSQITVFMVIGERNVQVGTYSVSHEPAYIRYIDIAVAYWPEKKAVGMGSVVSEEPRSSRAVENRPEYGDPNQPIVNWIAALPKTR